MRWLASLVVGVITGLITMVLAFYAAALAADWYSVSSFEGESGYFVVALALLGLICGFVIGVVVSRVVASRAKPGFVKALGFAVVTSGGIVLIIGTIARLQADVPPVLNGQTMLLSAEFKWPEGKSPGHTAGDATWSIRLSSSTGRTVRASRTGPLWRDDARLEDGRWVVPGAVELFTGRGERILDVLPDNLIGKGFIVPLPARPGEAYLTWSDWLPHAREGEPPLPDGFHYRFRVVPADRAVRTEVFGPFEIATMASGFHEVTSGWAASGTFQIRHKGQPVVIEHTPGNVRFEQVKAVAAVGGPNPALLVQVESRDVLSTCYLVSVSREQLRTSSVGDCPVGLQPAPLTSDSAAFALARDKETPPGRFDRRSYSTVGRYLLTGMVLDTTTLTLRPFSIDGQPELIGRVPPVGVSPDGESFIRLEFNPTNNEHHTLAVTVPATGERYRLPIDKARMRYADFDQIDPAWVLHHFAWERTKGGAYSLAERAGFTPIAWRGTLTQDGTGYREYRVAPAKADLRGALIEFLITEFQAERLPAEKGAYAHGVRVKGATISISYNESEHHVGVWMDRGTDSTLVATIAQRFDAALATGRYDHLFES